MLGSRSTADGPTDEGRTVATPELFELLADETRFEIVRALWGPDDGPLGYSEIRRRANVDDSSRFNYHLMRLTGTLVADVDDGYRLRSDAEPLLAAVFETESDDRAPRLAAQGQ